MSEFYEKFKFDPTDKSHMIKPSIRPGEWDAQSFCDQDWSSNIGQTTRYSDSQQKIKINKNK